MKQYIGITDFLNPIQVKNMLKVFKEAGPLKSQSITHWCYDEL